MATWITHMMIADMVQQDLQLDPVGFCVGNVAPDCNVENEDWTAFTPPREVTHWMNGSSKLSADIEGFYSKYIQGKRFTSREHEAFLWGYYSHLITDMEFQRFVRDEPRVQRSFDRIMANPTMRDKLCGLPRTFDTLKQVFGKNRIFRDVAIVEKAYLEMTPESGYHTVLCQIKQFPDYLDYFPAGAILRKIGLMTQLPKIDANEELMFFTKEEVQSFVNETGRLICRSIKDKAR